jgi:hypothetical protein
MTGHPRYVNFQLVQSISTACPNFLPKSQNGCHVSLQDWRAQNLGDPCLGKFPKLVISHRAKWRAQPKLRARISPFIADSALHDSRLKCSISRQLSRYYHDTCEKRSFVALRDMDGVSHFWIGGACLSDPAKSLVVEPHRNFSKILVFRRVFLG